MRRGNGGLWAEAGWSVGQAAALHAEAPLRCPTGDRLPVSLLLDPAQLRAVQVRPQAPPPGWSGLPIAPRPGEWDGPVLAIRSLNTGLSGGEPATLTWAEAGWLRAAACRRRAPRAAAGRLPALGGPGRVDDLGVIVLAVDRSGRALIARRSRRLGLRGGAWTATASGAVDPQLDQGPAGPGLGIGLRAGARELVEEAGLGPAAVERLEPLGLVREWRRGGKPELVLRARVRTARALWLHPSDEISVMCAIPDEELRRDPARGGAADLPLRVALALHWLDRSGR